MTLKAAGVCFSSGWMSISVFFAGSQTLWAAVVVVVIVVVVLAPLPWQWYIGWRFRICYSAEMTGLFQNSLSFSFSVSVFFTCLSLSLSFSLSRLLCLSVSVSLSPSWFGALHRQLYREWKMEWGLLLPYFGVILILHECNSVANI